MRTTAYALLSALTLALAACTKAPDPEYRLSAAQLAWQPYQAGQTLRFGNGNAAVVRTYNISKVDNRMESYTQSGGGISLFPVPSYKRQEIDVLVARTDSSSVYGPTELLHLEAAPARAEAYARVGWGTGFVRELALNTLLAGQPLPDTTTTLLPQLQLGSQMYYRVVRLSRHGGASVGSRTVQRVFYAERFGVVGFVEGRTLWYRLP